MRIVKKSMFLIIVLLILACGTTKAECFKFINGTAQINAYTKNKELIKITISTVKYSSQTTYRNGFMWGADEQAQPKSLISNINISVGKEKIFVPISAYCGLANPNGVRLKVSNDSFILTIMGGDAAGSYEGELVFENLQIKSKKVVHGEFPKTFEKTEYSFFVDEGL